MQPTGLANVLSTASRAPASWAIPAAAAISVRRSNGLQGVSMKISLVSGRTDAARASRSEVSTLLTATPIRGRVSRVSSAIPA